MKWWKTEVRNYIEVEQTSMVFVSMIGATARRVKIGDQTGASNIPALTSTAEELSKLTTLDEVRLQWKRFNGPAVVAATSTSGGFFGLGLGRGRKSKAPATRLRPTKKAAAPVVM